MLSRNEATGETEARQVTATAVHRTLQTVSVTLADAKTGQRQTIVCTPSHPFYVQGQGFTPAGSLGIGTSVVTRAGPSLSVSSVGLQPEQAGASEGTLVYNLTVEGDHTYFVGTVDGGAWVHNACRDPLHHIFPRFRKNPIYNGWFERHGIDPDAFTVPMDTPYLRSLHSNVLHGYRGGPWNAAWRDFIDAESSLGRNYSQEEIWTKAIQMMDKYKIPANWEPYR